MQIPRKRDPAAPDDYLKFVVVTAVSLRCDRHVLAMRQERGVTRPAQLA